ncbi:MarR family transcriptional regulator [Arsukibacterium sp. MJ3]|uniref:BlaI/MecI/CopY family transcriptional regulator n=1 Tax=Arsukibacterium sp. MJ3 TaxID=1632859 RepID=UPI000626F891|nr:BlaI/MecI/CopY family transcriptional regulator [Arsukibacterium sp. MJ3]KKO48886.1 MarR family transcriptional regulator [Arsukibacterium sp. MJ3]
MVRKKSTELTSAEQKVMQVLWQHGPCSVKTITAELNKQAALAYTTVQTLCRILLDKGHVQCEKQGKAFIYQAITVQQEARTQALTVLLKRFFAGSPTLLAQHLLEQPLPAELQQELQAQIDAQAKHAATTEKQER